MTGMSLGGGMWRVSCLPPNYQHSRPLIAALHQAPDGSGCVREEGRCNSQVWRRVMRHTPEVNGASSPPLLYAGCASLWRPVSSPCMHAGVLVGPGRERWGIGCRRRRELPDPRSGRGPHPRDGRRARMPGRLDPSSAAVDLEVDEAAGKAAVPRAPDLGGERVRPPDSAPYLDPSFQNTAPPSQPAQHNEDTRFPLLFWTLYSPWTLLLYYFCLIKASPRPDATPTVSVVCSSRHSGQVPSPAGKWNQHLHKACQQKEAWSALKFPGRWLRWLWTSENTVDQHYGVILLPNVKSALCSAKVD